MSMIGIPIGFYGYIFPGNINLMVMELYNSKRYYFLIFIIGLVVFFESIYCVISLIFLNSIRNNYRFLLIIEFISYALLLVMGFWMIIESKKQINKSKQYTIVRGILNIIIHPQQIPFWIVMGSFLGVSFDLGPNCGGLILFTFYNSIGTLLAMVFYMFFGRMVLIAFKFHIFQINKVIGSLYILVFAYHLIKLLKLSF